MITESMLDSLREDMRVRLSASRYKHTLGVEKEMRVLAGIYMPTFVLKAAAAGLLHDVTKELSLSEHTALCERYGIAVLEKEGSSAALLHAKTGAFYARERYPLYVDDDVFSAIYKHTVASEDMSLLDNLLYLADFIDEGRRYDACRAVRGAFYNGISSCNDKLAFLNEIMILAYDASLDALKRGGCYISEETLLARKKAVQARFATDGKN